MRGPLLLAFLVTPFVELYVIVAVGHRIGFAPTLLGLLAVSVLGGLLVRREGIRTWRAFGETLAAGRVPTRAVSDGALLLLGGALLVTPGFVTDAIGLLLVLPPTRALVRPLLVRTLAARLVGPPAAGAPRRERVVDAEVVEPDEQGPER